MVLISFSDFSPQAWITPLKLHILGERIRPGQAQVPRAQSIPEFTQWRKGIFSKEKEEGKLSRSEHGLPLFWLGLLVENL